MKMTLLEAMEIKGEDEELVVFDKYYDMETYFYYKENPTDKWDKAMKKIAENLKVTKIMPSGVEVNLSDAIIAHIKQLEKADLFYDYDIDSIMENMMEILAGNVTESWLAKFADALAE